MYFLLSVPGHGYSNHCGARHLVKLHCRQHFDAVLLVRLAGYIVPAFRMLQAQRAAKQSEHRVLIVKHCYKKPAPRRRSGCFLFYFAIILYCNYFYLRYSLIIFPASRP